MPIGVTHDGVRDTKSCDHWFVNNNLEQIEKAANLSAKIKPQMIHNHSDKETCSAFTKCRVIQYRAIG